VSGPTGKTGDPSTANPMDGEDGVDGTVNMYIESADNQITGPYSSPFKLEVTEFEIVDGNEDGILEFGEDITLRNIRVSNSGKINFDFN
jgi:hypothetical protein